MDYTYLACEWYVDTEEIEHMTILMTKAEELGFEFRLCRFYRTDKEYEIVGFNLKLPTDAELGALLSHIPSDSGLTNWSPITKDEHDKCVIDKHTDTIFPTVHKWSRSSPYNYYKVMDGIWEAAHANEQLKKYWKERSGHE